MSAPTHRDIAHLAALLHDIGKFYQRADDNQLRNSTLLEQEVKSLEAAYCPQYRGRYSHKHVLWTAQFLADHEQLFKELCGSNFNLLFKAAVGHHRPGDSLHERIVQKADHYSSGADRSSESHEDAAAEESWDSFRKVRMVSVFEHLLNGQSGAAHRYALATKPLRLDDSVFPRLQSETAAADYAGLWSGFVSEFSKINTRDFRAFQHTLLQLLEKYLVYVPSSTIHLPDVSLFDHLKSTAAFALCLHDYLSENNKNPADLKSEEEPVLLVGGDISGIQKFIYDIVSSDAAKNLKGRSFYLQLLAESISDRLVSCLNLYHSSVVYASGGSFYLLAPNTSFVRREIAEFRSLLETELFEAHGSSLSVSIDFVPVSEQALLRQEINLCWRSLSEKLSAAKRRKYADLMRLNYSRFFEPLEVGGQQARDFITGEELSAEELKDKKLRISAADDKKPVGKYTWLQIELGKQLKRAQAILIAPQPLNYLQNAFSFRIPADPRTYYLLPENWKPQSADQVEIRKLNDLDFLDHHFQGNAVSLGFSFYGGNRFPSTEEGTPLTFDKLTETEGGFRRLGVLRMDVDNLGSVFIDGLGSSKRTFSRYASISRSLDLFFRGWLNTLWESREDYKKHTYIVYSGGDDLFVVGRWDVLIRFAEDIRNKFKEYTCHNTSLTLSGGIALVTDRFPISKAAALAEKAEKAAKRHEISGTGIIDKNAFCFLGFPLHWEEEWPVVQLWKQQLLNNIVSGPKLPKSLLRKLIQFDEIREWQISHAGNESWRWMMAYDFARAAERVKSEHKEELRQLLHGIKNDVMTDTCNGKKTKTKYPTLRLLHIAARWAELELRD